MNQEENAGAPATQPKPGTARYRVTLPVDIEGTIYQYGQTVDLDEATATAYSHALLSVDAIPAPVPAKEAEVR
jgi:hypothetical protein